MNARTHQTTLARFFGENLASATTSPVPQAVRPRCRHCQGGQVSCPTCHGAGDASCYRCAGRGRIVCLVCGGEAVV